MPWRNRITGSGEEAPDQLLANPANWRIHPKAQQAALAGALDTVGWVQQVMVNQRTGFVVDGHARVALALSRGEATMPVLYVDLDPPEEAVILATLDPISATAGRDDEKLRALLADITVDDAGLRALLADVPEVRADLLHAIYDRLVVAGRSIVGARLTPAAYSNGLALALPQLSWRARGDPNTLCQPS